MPRTKDSPVACSRPQRLVRPRLLDEAAKPRSSLIVDEIPTGLVAGRV